jgi:hypothetical protein
MDATAQGSPEAKWEMPVGQDGGLETVWVMVVSDGP